MAKKLFQQLDDGKGKEELHKDDVNMLLGRPLMLVRRGLMLGLEFGLDMGSSHQGAESSLLTCSRQAAHAGAEGGSG
eukprot:scaffold6425_cov101-Isochrysis_galbana.AAC.1